MERLKHIKEAILACIEGEVMNIAQSDTKELGEAIDMLKDLSEAIYYCTITEAMEGKDKEKGKEREVMYYPYPMYDYNMNYANEGGNNGRRSYYDPYRDMDRNDGRMYYNGNSSSNGDRGMNNSSSNGSSSRSYYEREYPYPIDMRDRREGRSPMNRKMYMEAKEMHHGKEVQMKELESYMQELTSDITEMIKGSSAEEKQLMQKKIAALAEKVGQVNV